MVNRPEPPCGAPAETAAGAYRRARLFLAAAQTANGLTRSADEKPLCPAAQNGVSPPEPRGIDGAGESPLPPDSRAAAGARLSLEARELVCAAAGLSRNEFYLRPGAPVDSARLNALLTRRAAGEPLAYLLGEWDFYGYPFKTDARALIPRDDSAAPLELSLSLLPAAPPSGRLLLLDLCTGSGCLGIAAVRELAGRGVCARAVLADNSEAALALARENIARHGLTGSVHAAYADVFALDRFEAGGASPAGFDGCICNPPYIESAAVAGLDRDVTAFEPLSALDGGRDGLDFYRAAAAGLPRLLRQGGIVTFEVGFAQAEPVAALLAAAGYADIRTAVDSQDVVRAVAARVRGE